MGDGDGTTVRTVEAVVRGEIREWFYDGQVLYDWIDSAGDESDETFASADEAADDFMRRYR